MVSVKSGFFARIVATCFHCKSEERRTGRTAVEERLTSGVIDSETGRSEEHTSELQSRLHVVCRLLLEKKSWQNSLLRCLRESNRQFLAMALRAVISHTLTTPSRRTFSRAGHRQARVQFPCSTLPLDIALI